MNDQLIEEARRAFNAAWAHVNDNVQADNREPGQRSRAGIRAAFAVFEKAHTPTDDEREAIINALLDELGWDWDEVPEEHIPSTREILGDMADRVLAVADRFRPTPSELSEALEAMTAEKEKWRKRCAEETIAWADEAAENQRLRSATATTQGEPEPLSAHIEAVAYADDIAEGGDPVPEDYERHYCDWDGEDWPCARVRAIQAPEGEEN